VPYTYELLERIGFRDKAVASLRTLTQAGGRLAPALVTTYARWAKDRGVRFFVMYGQTEATARMAYLPPDRTLAQPESIGVAIPGGSFRLIDADGREIDQPDTVGELVYVGPNVMMGYGQAPGPGAGPGAHRAAHRRPGGPRRAVASTASPGG
jgi:acyl-coenzyme A synthetase/AMP-(fatty) acid ligase